MVALSTSSAISLANGLVTATYVTRVFVKLCWQVGKFLASL
jgi:hypothetical protein